MRDPYDVRRTTLHPGRGPGLRTAPAARPGTTRLPVNLPNHLAESPLERLPVRAAPPARVLIQAVAGHLARSAPPLGQALRRLAQRAGRAMLDLGKRIKS